MPSPALASTATPADREPSNTTLEHAAEWYALLRSGQASEQERSRWQAWLDLSAEHRKAWRYVEDISLTFASLSATPDPAKTADNVYQASVRVRQRRRVLTRLALAGATGLLASAGYRREWLPTTVLAWAATYRSAVGEQREIVLADGSHVWLNTDSAFNTDYSAVQRQLALVTGEIFIATAHDAQRQFVVDTPEGRLRALGTRFNVRLADGRTLLAVYEGAVEITPRDGDARIIRAGEQASFSRRQVDPTAPADLARQAWTQGVLVAQNITLREMVQELRRYTRGHIGLADDIAELKVYGTFPIKDTDRTLAMLTTVLPVRVRQTLPWWVALESVQQNPA